MENQNQTNEVVEPLEPPIEVNEQINAEENTEAVADGNGNAINETAVTNQHEQSLEERAHFAAIRREQEAQEQAIRDKVIAENYANVVKPLTGEPILSKADLEDAQRQFEMQQALEQKGVVTPEEQASFYSKQREYILKSDPEIARLRQENEFFQKNQIVEIMQKDLKAIQAIDPAVKNLNDLGEQFQKLISIGTDAVVAYNAVKATLPKPQPSPGNINSSQKETSDFFTREQVFAMSLEQKKTNHDKIRKSMEKWT